MGEKFEYGTPVRANIGGTVQLAFVTGGPHSVQGASGPEEKYKVTGLDGEEHNMAFTAGAGHSPPGGFFTRG